MPPKMHGGARKGAGRPSKFVAEQVAVRFTKEQLEWIDSECTKGDCTRSELLRSVVDAARLKRQFE